MKSVWQKACYLNGGHFIPCLPQKIKKKVWQPLPKSAARTSQANRKAEGKMAEDIFITAAARTAIGGFHGALAL